MTMQLSLQLAGALLLLILRSFTQAIESAAGRRASAMATLSGQNEDELSDAARALIENQRQCLPATQLIGAMLLIMATYLFYWTALEIKSNIWPQLADYPLIAALAVLVVAPAILIALEWWPRMLGRRHTDLVLERAAPTVNTFSVFLMWALQGLTALAGAALKPLGVDRVRHDLTFNQEDLLNLVEDESEPETGEAPAALEERAMIREIIDLSNTMAREVMRPLNSVVTLRLPGRSSDAIELASSTGYTRFPVSVDKIIDLTGYVNVLQILRENQPDKPLTDYVQKAYYVPETKRVDELLQEFLDNRIRCAIVFDEYGSCSGWITREDLLEEIVGEIEDEFDTHVPELELVDARRWRASGQFGIDDLNERFELDIQRERYDTIGGMIYDELGRVPVMGDVVTWRNVEFEVLAMDRLRIESVEIRLIDDEENES